MNNLMLLFLVVLAGCASATQLKGPDGGAAYLVKCGSAFKEKCNQKAAEVCPQGYRVLDRNTTPYDDLNKIGNVGKLEIATEGPKTIMVECK